MDEPAMDELLGSLFDVPVAACTLCAGQAMQPLGSSELALVGASWSEKRRLEFEAGRHCAKRALSRLVPQVDEATLSRGVSRDADGAPCFPEGIAGSITHTGRGDTMFAAAVVSRAVRTVGIDAELHAPLSAEIRERVLNGDEARKLERLARGESELGHLALIVFSAKEAFYKCQYPVTRTFLDFHAVEVELDVASGRFIARLSRDAGPLAVGSTFDGRFTARDGLVISAICLA